MGEDICSGCGAEIGTGVCMCPDGTPSVRNAIIEECAKVADLYPGVYGNSPTAAEIRKMKSN